MSVFERQRESHSERENGRESWQPSGGGSGQWDARVRGTVEVQALVLGWPLHRFALGASNCDSRSQCGPVSTVLAVKSAHGSGKPPVVDKDSDRVAVR